MRLIVLADCPGTGWVPGQSVDATVEEARKWADGIHASVLREERIERAVRR